MSVRRPADEKRTLAEARRQRRLAMTAIDILKTSNGAATRAFRPRLEGKGQAGVLGSLLLGTYQAFSRAEAYRGGIRRGRKTVSYRDLSYDRKDQHLAKLAVFLDDNPSLGLTWGWDCDRDSGVASHVLNVDLPEGQVSFHSQKKHRGLNYPGAWDGRYESECWIVAYCNQLL